MKRKFHWLSVWKPDKRFGWCLVMVVNLDKRNEQRRDNYNHKRGRLVMA
jgi:hypothetical protein